MVNLQCQFSTEPLKGFDPIPRLRARPKCHFWNRIVITTKKKLFCLKIVIRTNNRYNEPREHPAYVISQVHLKRSIMTLTNFPSFQKILGLLSPSPYMMSGTMPQPAPGSKSTLTLGEAKSWLEKQPASVIQVLNCFYLHFSLILRWTCLMKLNINMYPHPKAVMKICEGLLGLNPATVNLSKGWAEHWAAGAGAGSRKHRVLFTVVLPSPTGQFRPILRGKSYVERYFFLVRATETTKPVLKPPLPKV